MDDSKCQKRFQNTDGFSAGNIEFHIPEVGGRFSVAFGDAADEFREIVQRFLRVDEDSSPLGQELAGFLRRHDSARFSLPDAFADGGEGFLVFFVEDWSRTLEFELLCR